MPSKPRKHQLYGSLVYHVYNRSHRGVPIFEERDDFERFMDLLKEYKEKFSISIYHWAIMVNHYHLQMEIPVPEELSSCMSGLGRAYTYYYHDKNNTYGYLWQGRFQSQPVQIEQYHLACGRYIERNPLRKGLVEEASQYAYSSARYYCLGVQDGITSTDPRYLEFGDDAQTRSGKYADFLKDFDHEGEKLFRNRCAPAGDTVFLGKLVKKGGHYFPRRAGRPGGNISFTT